MNPRAAAGPGAPCPDPQRVRFVLVGPQSAGNVGSVARALKNLGFTRLTLVGPCCRVSDPEAIRLAVSARDVLEAATVHDDLDAALAGAQIVVGASRRTGRQRQPHWRLDRFVSEVSWPDAAEAAFVFGREDSGLRDDELDLCTHLIHLPASDDYPSFNLAQAVLLVAYELRLARIGPAPPALAEPADHAEREAMFAHLRDAFLAIGFVHDDTVESIMRRVRRLFGRAILSDDEVRLLRGLARQTQWAAGRAGLTAEPGPASPDAHDG